MDPIMELEATIKQELPELPESECTDFDLNALESVEIDLKPPAPHLNQSPLEIGSKNSAFQPYKVSTFGLTMTTKLSHKNCDTFLTLFTI